MDAAQLKICYSYPITFFGAGMVLMICSLLSDEPFIRNLCDFMGKNVCCLASGMLGHLLLVIRQLRAEAAKAQREDRENLKSWAESSTSSTVDTIMGTPVTDDSQSLSDEERAEPSNEDKIAALIRERKNLLATKSEDEYALRAASIQHDELSQFSRSLEYTDKKKAKAEQERVAAWKKYMALCLLRDKKNLRLERIKLDIAALEKGRPGLLWEVATSLRRQRAFKPYRNKRLTSIIATRIIMEPKPLTITMTQSTVLITYGILQISAIPLLAVALCTILSTPGMLKKWLESYLSVVIWALPFSLGSIMCGLGASFEVTFPSVLVISAAVIAFDAYAYAYAAKSETSTTECMQEQKRYLDPDHPDYGTPVKVSEKTEKFFQELLLRSEPLKQGKIAASPPSPRPSFIAFQKDGHSDTSDDSSTIYTPAETEVSTTSITDDLQHARQQKKDLEAAEFDEEHERQMARLNIEEEEIRYESKPKYSEERAAALIALEGARSAFATLEYLKKRKAVTLKKMDLEIRYLEKKSKDELYTKKFQ